MATSKNDRFIFVHRWSLEICGRAKNYQPITNECAENYHPIANECAEKYQPNTNECAENYQPITNEWSLGSRGCARRTVAWRKVEGQHLLLLQLPWPGQQDSLDRHAPCCTRTGHGGPGM